MGRPHKCPYCGQSTSISKGVRRTKTMGNRCIRLCKACRRKFTPKHQQGPEREDSSLNAATEVVRESRSQSNGASTAVDVQPQVIQPEADIGPGTGGAE